MNQTIESNQLELEKRIQLLENEITRIKDRNYKVELEKAWEISKARKIAILVLTYLLASLVLFAIGVEQFLLSAIIPTLGYFLSTLSVSWLKSIWVRNKKQSKI